MKIIRTSQYDRREYSYYPSYITEDWNSMSLIFEDDLEEIRCPAKAVVCPTCRGKGQYVNPAIDSHGLTSEDFAQDPDLAEGYMSGRYNIPCKSCNGKNVILEPAEPNSDCAQKLNEIMN